jgi:hypothetical protein
MSLLNTLEEDLGRRTEDASAGYVAARDLNSGIKSAAGADLEPALVHPVDYEDRRIAFLLVDEDDNVILARYEPPATTVVFLGSLVGGEYREIVIRDDKGTRIEGFFKHRRLGDEELRVVYQPLPGIPEGPVMPETRDALERAARLRDYFKRWSISVPEPPQ